MALPINAKNIVGGTGGQDALITADVGFPEHGRGLPVRWGSSGGGSNLRSLYGE